MGDVFIRYGYFILSDGMIVKYNSSGSDKELDRAKKLAIKVGMKKVAYNNGNIYLYNDYNYWNKKNVIYYIVYPLVGLIGLTVWLTI